MKISLLPLAQTELDEAFSWYEEQAIGLGYEFLDEFDQSIRLTNFSSKSIFVRVYIHLLM